MSKRTPESDENKVLGFGYLELITDLKMQLKNKGYKFPNVVDKPVFHEGKLVTFPIDVVKNGNCYTLTFLMENELFCVKLETEQQEIWRFESSKLKALQKNKTKKNQAIFNGVINAIDKHSQ